MLVLQYINEDCILLLTASLNPANLWSFPSAVKMRIPHVPASRCQLTNSISLLEIVSPFRDLSDALN